MWLVLGLSLMSFLVFTIGAALSDRYLRYYALCVLALSGLRFVFERYCRPNEFQQLLLVYGPIGCALAEYSIYRLLIRKKVLLSAENLVSRVFFFPLVLFTLFVFQVYLRRIWITPSLAILSLSITLWGSKIRDKYIRTFSLFILFYTAVRFSLIDDYSILSKPVQWLLIALVLSLIYAVYFIFRSLEKKGELEAYERQLVKPLFYASSLLLVIEIFKYVKEIWVALSLGLAGALLFAAGFLIKEKVFRHGGFIIFGIALLRIMIVDLAGLPMVYKIVSFIVLGTLFLGVSFFYTRYASASRQEK